MKNFLRICLENEKKRNGKNEYREKEEKTEGEKNSLFLCINPCVIGPHADPISK